MKSYLIPFFAFAISWSVTCHADEPTLLHDSDYWNFYFQPELLITKIQDDSAEFIGTEIGASLNERIDLGIIAHWLINDVNLDDPSVDDAEEGQIWNAGLMLRYHFAPCRLGDISLQTMVAGGRVKTGNKTDGNNGNTDFMLIEPSLVFGWNLTDHTVFGFRLGFRAADGSDSRLIEDNNLSGPVAAVFFRIDEF